MWSIEFEGTLIRGIGPIPRSMDEKIGVHAGLRLSQLAVPFHQANSVGYRPSAMTSFETVNVATADHVDDSVFAPQRG